MKRDACLRHIPVYLSTVFRYLAGTKDHCGTKFGTGLVQCGIGLIWLCM